MKIQPKSVDAFLAKPSAPYGAALLYGPDAGLVRDRTKRITTAVLGANPDPMAIVELSEANVLADSAILADELGAISMLAPRRVIVIRDGGDKLTKIIEASAQYLNDSVFLIVAADELAGKSSLRAWFEADARAAAVACYRDEMRDVAGVVRKAFDDAKLPYDREVVDYLSAQLGNDRYVTYQELEKIITYAGGQKLTLEEVTALVDYNRETNLDDIVNAVADRNLAQLEKMLNLLLHEGTQPIAYLRALQRYFNRLYNFKAQAQAGMPVDQLVANARPKVFFRQVPILTRHIQSWSLEHITRALGLLVSAELSSKTTDATTAYSSRCLMQIAHLR